MGTSWEYFKNYEIKADEDYGDDIIHYLDGGLFKISFPTSAQLALAVQNFGVILPVYDYTEPPESKILDDLIAPIEVALGAQKALDLLKTSVNPLVKSFYSSDKYQHLFDEKDIDGDHTVESLNERIRSYLEKMVLLSNEGHYFIRSRD
ncbi:hypothetical protein ABE82_26155 (plasmid) [Paenibacillus peoriae]|uniref:hypothetical protein n=1 Tax=Paenibacillus peoriae TaxID=59893 RepID=UPI0007213291|nr:hypothetical protein [Paenibacillus peoriae]ALS09905.1 hypothetical protein ABE82_26155 [Paenibacillus peoriae]